MTLLTEISNEVTNSESYNPSSDLTTILTGLAGAIIGAVIALLANYISIREQRRRNLREQIVSFLGAADTIDVTASSLRSAIRNDNHARINQLIEQLRTQNLEIDRHRQYIELIARRNFRKLVNDAHSEIRALSGLAMYPILPFDDDSIENSRTPETLKAESTENAEKYQSARQRIIQSINPYLKNPEPKFGHG